MASSLSSCGNKESSKINLKISYCDTSICLENRLINFEEDIFYLYDKTCLSCKKIDSYLEKLVFKLNRSITAVSTTDFNNFENKDLKNEIKDGLTERTGSNYFLYSYTPTFFRYVDGNIFYAINSFPSYDIGTVSFLIKENLEI